MVELSEVLFKRVRSTMEQKDTLDCQLGRCLMGECSLTECPVEEWISKLRETVGFIHEETVTLEASVFHVLSDPLRLKIVKLLAAKGKLCACEIQAAIGENQSSTSYHIGLLRKAGIVTAEKRGIWAYYNISSPMVLSIINMANKIRST